jgi:hypothetical protein
MRWDTEWLQDKNGALYRVAAITAVIPLEMREDKRDQSKVTAVHAAIVTAGGHVHNTSLLFADAVKIVNPPPPPAPAPVDLPPPPPPAPVDLPPPSPPAPVDSPPTPPAA